MELEAEDNVVSRGQWTLDRSRSVVPQFHSGDLGGLGFVGFSKAALTERLSLEEPRAPITRLQARSWYSAALLDASLVCGWPVCKEVFQCPTDVRRDHPLNILSPQLPGANWALFLPGLF